MSFVECPAKAARSPTSRVAARRPPKSGRARGPRCSAHPRHALDGEPRGRTDLLREGHQAFHARARGFPTPARPRHARCMTSERGGRCGKPVIRSPSAVPHRLALHPEFIALPAADPQSSDRSTGTPKSSCCSSQTDWTYRVTLKRPCHVARAEAWPPSGARRLRASQSAFISRVDGSSTHSRRA